MPPPAKESLGFMRLMLIVSGLSPLYILWAIRGIKVVPDEWMIGSAFIVVLSSYAILWWRIQTAKHQNDYRDIKVTAVTDHREHLLTYLVAIMLPLYDANLGTTREAIAILCAFMFIVFLFWHMNLHYMNPLFALLGYHLLSLEPSTAGDPALVVITKRARLEPDATLRLLRLSNTVYLDLNP